MQNNHIVIKEQQKNWLLKGFLYLGAMIAALAFTFIPLFSGNPSNKMLFYILGGLAFTVFTTLFVLLLYKVCNPGIALILNARGFIDKKNIGDRIVIDWKSISAVKQLGKKEMPYLGISLENIDTILSQMKSKDADAIRENLNNNLPAILIAQNEINMPIKELKDLFTKYAREARALTADSKNKQNSDIVEDAIKTQIDSTPIHEKEDTTINAEAETENTEEQPETEATPVVSEYQQPAQFSNNFYEELLKQAESESSEESAEKPEDNQKPVAQETKENAERENNVPDLISVFDIPESSSDTEDEKTIVISEEFTDILNQARSAKILELDKILNDKETAEDNSKQQIREPIITADVMSNIESKSASPASSEKSEIKISDLEAMIENALQNVEGVPNINIEADEIEDEKETIPEINLEDLQIPEPTPQKTKKKKTFVLNEKK